MTEIVTDQTAAPRRHPRLPLVLAYALAAVAMLGAYLGLLPWMVPRFIPGLREWIQDLPDGVQLFLGALQSLTIAATAVLIVWALMRWVCGRTLREAGFFLTRRSLPLLLLGVIASCLVTMPTMMLLGLADLDGPSPVIEGSVWGFVVNALVLAFIMQGFPEELVWRGYALQLLERRPVLSVVVCAVLFGVMHLVSLGGGYDVGERIAYLVTPAGFGFLAGALVLLTRSLWPAVGVHGGSHVADLLLTLMGYGEGGATAWVAIGVVYVVAGLVVLWLWHRRGGGPVRFEH